MSGLSASSRLTARAITHPVTGRTTHHDEGSATITTAGLIIALTLIVLVFAHNIHTTIAYHHAQVAANLSATAGAFAAYTGADPCDTAAQIARRNAAELDRCNSATTGDITVTITYSINVIQATATATAGPS